ncbi:MAG: class I SAM-dependent methyltransferase [Pseudomonadota bacterium]|nr:class I SAM-dependent methyltransferase [Pseudomonadota bacterium]
MTYKPLDDYRERVEEIAKTLESNPQTLAIYRRVTDAVDPERVRHLQDKYAAQLADFDPIGIYKYADLPFWIGHKVTSARELGLDACAPKTILDIGMGAGHFAAVCQALGHTVVGTDISVPLYDDICEALQLDRRIEPTRHRTPLPDLGTKFDLVTTIWQVFHVLAYHPNGDRDHWSTEDWRFFLDDLARRHMRYPGAIYLHLNPNIGSEGQAFDAALLEWSRQRGAKIDETWGKILFQPIMGPEIFADASATESVLAD